MLESTIGSHLTTLVSNIWNVNSTVSTLDIILTFEMYFSEKK